MRQGLPSCRSFSWQSDFPWAGACRFPKPTHSASHCTPGIPCSFCKPGLLPPPASPKDSLSFSGSGGLFGFWNSLQMLFLSPSPCHSSAGPHFPALQSPL